MTLEEWISQQPKAIYCERCGRILTDEASKKAGIGPICVDKTEESEDD